MGRIVLRPCVPRVVVVVCSIPHHVVAVSVIFALYHYFLPSDVPRGSVISSNIIIPGSSPPHTTVRPVYFYREKTSALSSLLAESWDVSITFFGVGKKRRGWVPRGANLVVPRRADRGAFVAARARKVRVGARRITPCNLPGTCNKGGVAAPCLGQQEQLTWLWIATSIRESAWPSRLLG